MTPLDQELRTALAARAAAVDPSPDPLAGIETRARGLRRRRLLTAVVGAALAVTAVAVAVPALNSQDRGAGPSQFATVPPTPGASGPTPTPGTSPATATAPAAPGNVLAWPVTGQAPAAAEVVDVTTRYAAARKRRAEEAHYRALHSDLTESGVRYTVGQAWLDGDHTAFDVSWVQDRSTAPVFHVWGATPRTPAVRAFVLGIAATFSSDLLILVPRPGVGQLSYSPDATTALSPVASGPDPVALLPRPAGSTGDRVEVLDGDGNLDRPLYRGPVSTLLCGLTACP